MFWDGESTENLYKICFLEKRNMTVVAASQVHALHKHDRQITAKLYVFAIFINFNDNPLSTLVRRAISSKSCRKWKVTLSIITIRTCKVDKQILTFEMLR